MVTISQLAKYERKRRTPQKEYYTSIFIASIMINVSPSSTLCPDSTNTCGRQYNIKRLTVYYIEATYRMCTLPRQWSMFYALATKFARFRKPLFNLKFGGQQSKKLKRYVYANYVTPSRGVLWNIPQVTSIFSVHLWAFRPDVFTKKIQVTSGIFQGKPRVSIA